MKRILSLEFALFIPVWLGACLSAVAAPAADSPAVPALQAVEIPRPGPDGDAAILARAVFLTYDSRFLYVVDAMDCAVKIFTKDGRFAASVGHKGNGPGELSFPSGVSVAAGRLFVADKLNHRIQILDPKGAPLGGFPLPFAPDKIHFLGEGRILVSRDGPGRPGASKLLAVFDERGGLLWEGLDARSSGDPVYDTFLNMILVMPGGRGDFYIVFKSQERIVFHWSGAGGPPSAVTVDVRYKDKPLTLPLPGGERELRGFCWDSAFDRGAFYLLAPEYTPEKDLGPGRRIYRIEGSGRLSSTIDLPFPASRFAVEDDRLYVLDAEGELRILRIAR